MLSWSVFIKFAVQCYLMKRPERMQKDQIYQLVKENFEDFSKEAEEELRKDVSNYAGVGMIKEMWKVYGLERWIKETEESIKITNENIEKLKAKTYESGHTEDFKVLINAGKGNKSLTKYLDESIREFGKKLYSDLKAKKEKYGNYSESKNIDAYREVQEEYRGKMNDPEYLDIFKRKLQLEQDVLRQLNNAYSSELKE